MNIDQDNHLVALETAEPSEDTTTPHFLKRFVSRLRSLVRTLWFILVGAVFCQAPVGAVFAMGWCGRFMQYTFYKNWFKLSSPDSNHKAFKPSVTAIPDAMHHKNPPRWFLHHAPIQKIQMTYRNKGIMSIPRATLVALTNGLYQNLRWGMPILLHTSLLLLPTMALWWFAWRYGWDNSFNKGYEQAALGPVMGVSGILWFMVAMLYIPLAQVHYTISHHWRAFYEFGHLIKIIRQSLFGSMLLAVLHFLGGMIVLISIVVPGLLPQINPATETMTDSELLQFLSRFFFIFALFSFPVYILNRWYAARLYTKNLYKAIQAGIIEASTLKGDARIAWDNIPLPEAFILKPAVHEIVSLNWKENTKKLLRVPRLAVQGAFLAVTLLVWFGMASQVYVGQFVNYQNARGWLNQPMIQAPWFNYTPQQLRESAESANNQQDSSGHILSQNTN